MEGGEDVEEEKDTEIDIREHFWEAFFKIDKEKGDAVKTPELTKLFSP